MTLLSPIVHGVWLASAWPEARRFHRGSGDIDHVQQSLLLDTVRRNAGTVFGREHGFGEIRTPEDYRRRVPIRTWDELAPYLERVATGEPEVLTAEPVRLLEPTGGSSGGSKLIPYTRTLQREFQRGIAPWIVDLYRRHPRLATGRSFWSISPQGHRPARGPGGIPVGFAADADYLGWSGRLLNTVMAAPAALKQVADIADFYLLLSYFLVRCRELALISIWSPTFFLPILDTIERSTEWLLRGLYEGRLMLPSGTPLPAPLRPGIAHRRGREVEAALSRPAAERYRHLWPRLELLSCWTDGAAAPHANQLSARLPGVTLQGKGLLATEGMITLPLAAAGGAVPAYRSHYLEFLPDGAGETVPVGALAEGETYRVIITTGGGLYRYDLGDRVTVAGRHGPLPILVFAGRPGVSDRCGEKLSEGHVAEAVRTALDAAGVRERFVLLAPESDPAGERYVLYLDADGDSLPERLETLLLSLETELCRNAQYAYCRRLGQLGPPQLVPIAGNGLERYITRCAEGQRLGDIKPAVLDSRIGWTAHFATRHSPD